MKIDELTLKIEKYAPLNLALEFDNVGLIVGNPDAHLSGIIVCLDVTIEIIDKAVDNNCNLIISHHPIIFNPIKRIVNGDRVSDVLLYAISNGISIYCAHTNMDNAFCGINFTLSKLIGIENPHKLLSDGSGVFGDIESICAQDLVNKLSGLIKDEKIKLYGNAKKSLKKIAVLSGSGGKDSSIADLCLNNSIDAYITAEVKHDVALEFIHKGVVLIEYGHYESERIFVDIVYNLLTNILKIENTVLKQYSSVFPN